MARAKSYVRPDLVEVLAHLITFLGLLAAVAGPAYAVNAATQAPATVRVQVQVDPGSPQGRQLRDARDLAVPAGRTAPGVATDATLLTATDLLTPTGEGYPAQLSAWDSTRTEQFLSRGQFALAGLGAGAAALLLRPLLLSIARGRPFGTGNSRRLAQLSLVVAATAHLAPLFPALAAGRVLGRLGLDAADGPLSVAPWLHLGPWTVVAFLLLVLAEAFRQGERRDRDLDGLV